MVKKAKGGPVHNKKKDEIKTILRTLIVQGNLGRSNSISYEELASKYETTRQTISNYVKEIYSSVPEEEIDKVYIDLRIIFDKLEKEVSAAVAMAENVRDKCLAINTYFRLVKEKIELLESFGKKAKVADTLNLQGEITHKSINFHIIDDRTQIKKEEISSAS